MKADPQTQLHVVNTVGPVRRGLLLTSFTQVLCVRFFIGALLAELIKQFLKYENGSGRAEDDEGLPTKDAEHSSCQSSAKEALHHTLGNEKEKDGGSELFRFQCWLGWFCCPGDLVVVSCISEQTSKCDGIGYAAQVDEEHSRDGLDMEPIIYVTAVPGDLPLDVQPQTTSKSVKYERNICWTTLGRCVRYRTANSNTAPPGEFQLIPRFVWSGKFVIFSCGRPACRAVHLTQFI